MRCKRPKEVYRYPPLAPIAIARKSRLLSIMRNHKIDFYQLAEKMSSASGPSITLDEKKLHIGSIGFSDSNKLFCSDLSDDGILLAVSNASGIFLFSIDSEEQIDDQGKSMNILVFTKIDLPDTVNLPCTSLKFSTSDSKLLICATCNGPLNTLQIKKNTKVESKTRGFVVSLGHSFSQHLSGDDSTQHIPVSIITISPDSKWLAVSQNTSENRSSIHVFSLLPTYKHWWSLPCVDTPHSCLRFLGGGDVLSALVLVCSDSSFYIFDIEQKCLSHWSQDLGFPVKEKLPVELIESDDCPIRLAFNPATPNKFIMGGQSWFCVIDLELPVPPHSLVFPPNHLKAKRLKRNHTPLLSLESELDESKSLNFKICMKYTGIIFMDFLDDNELLIVEQPALSILDALPDAPQRRRYGT